MQYIGYRLNKQDFFGHCSLKHMDTFRFIVNFSRSFNDLWWYAGLPCTANQNTWNTPKKGPKVAFSVPWRNMFSQHAHRKVVWYENRIHVHTPLKIDMEHNSLEVWFRSFSFLNRWLCRFHVNLPGGSFTCNQIQHQTVVQRCPEESYLQLLHIHN